LLSFGRSETETTGQGSGLNLEQIQNIKKCKNEGHETKKL